MKKTPKVFPTAKNKGTRISVRRITKKKSDYFLKTKEINHPIFLTAGDYFPRLALEGMGIPPADVIVEVIISTRSKK